MILNDHEVKFITKRKKLTRFFPIAGGLSLILIVGYLISAYLRSPIMFNPYMVQEKILNKQIEQSTLVLMSVMFPLAWSALFILVFALITFMFIWNSLEKKYLKIIERITEVTSNPR
jgi:Tfp pilus assembly protein PilN